VTDDSVRGDRSRAVTVGAAGLAAMVLTHLVWDPALTLLGVHAFGIGEEDSAVVRSLLETHPALWLGAKLLFVGGSAFMISTIGAYRDPLIAALLWVVAVYGFVAPLGWLELLVGTM